MNHRQNDLEYILPLCEFAYNDMAHGSTQNSPFFLTYGQNPRSAEDLHLGVTEFPTNPAVMVRRKTTFTEHRQGLLTRSNGSTGVLH